MFDLYIALGDSMSIDFYPAESAGRLSSRPDIGSASLLLQNEDGLFPEFVGRDLVTRFPGIAHTNLAVDGAVVADVLCPENLEIFATLKEQRSLVSVTAGGNNLLRIFNQTAGRKDSEMRLLFQRLLSDYTAMVVSLKERLPNADLLLSTVYDPTDGTGTMPTKVSMFPGKLPVELLIEFNEHIKETAKQNSSSLADVHSHFQGHGASCKSADEFWYWTNMPIEPGYKAASEIRRTWLSAIESLSTVK